MRRNYDRTTVDPRSVLHDLYSNITTYAPTAMSTPAAPNVTMPDFSTTPIVNNSVLRSVLNRSVGHVSETYVAPMTSPRTSELFNQSGSVGAVPSLTDLIVPMPKSVPKAAEVIPTTPVLDGMCLK